MRKCGVVRWAAIAAALALPACVPLPVRIAAGVEGVVVDARTREPLRGAVVVVRFEGRYDEVLPDRELLGHREAYTDGEGHFLIPRVVRPGLSAWPLFRAEARVVGVIREGYRCPEPRFVGVDRRVRIELEPAQSQSERQDSCRPVPAARGEAPTYMEAWRGLHPEVSPQGPEPRDPDLEHVLEARAALGFGENCSGPVTDLALSRDGRWVAYATLTPEGGDLHVLSLAHPGGPRPAWVGADPQLAGRRLAWNGTGELVLWEPASETDHSTSVSLFSPQDLRVVWRAPDAAPPAAPAPGLAAAPRPPLEPEDLNDEDDARWRHRSFWLGHDVDAETGLPADLLEVARPDGSRFSIGLPGEVCGPRGRFGRPHHRIAHDGRTGLDLRFVDGGCHLVKVDLESGAWEQLDAPGPRSVCRDTRRIPATHLRAAMRGYAREIEAAVIEAGADPRAAYVLRIAPDGSTTADSRDYRGERRSVSLPRFPVRTPLRRIHVTTLGAGNPGAGGTPLVPGAQPL